MEAEKCLAEALQAAIRGFGIDAPHVGMSANNIAEVYRVTGKLEQAKELYAQVGRLRGKKSDQKD